MKEQKSEPYENIEFNLTVSGKVHFELFQDSRRYVAPHWHDALEIISITDGQLLVNADGTQYRLQKGDCIILPPYSVHSTLSTIGNSSQLLQIPVGAFSECMGPLDMTRIICDPNAGNPDSQRCLKRIRALLSKIMEFTKSGEPAAGLRCGSLILETMYQVYLGFSDSEDKLVHSAGRYRNRERMAAVTSYTEAHYNEPISLEDIAAELHLQVNYFCHIFKENTGMTYLQYLNEYRLGKIYQDLIDTDTPLKYLLEKHGFTNYKLFRRMFSDRFGTTPGDVRRTAGSSFYNKNQPKNV